MNVLFLHNNFPAQFKNIIKSLAASGHDMRYMSMQRHGDITDADLLKVGNIIAPRPAKKNIADSAMRVFAETHQTAINFSRLMRPLKKLWQPDLIFAHPFWGGAYLAPEVFPTAKLITYCEWYYASTPEGWGAQRTRNSVVAFALLGSHARVAPMRWQKSQFPKELHDKIHVIHDGIDTDFFAPGDERDARIGDLNLHELPEIVTYATRSMEPSRGFPQFCRALPRVLAERPGCHAIIMAGAAPHYSPTPDGYDTWLDKMKAELPGLFGDPRVRIFNYSDYQTYRKLLRNSTVHVYMTEPIVLSWSMLEAMSTGCLLVASDTEPVREVITDGVNGVLAPLADHEKLAEKICDALARRDEMKCVAENARQTILENYSVERCMPKYQSFFERVLNS